MIVNHFICHWTKLSLKKFTMLVAVKKNFVKSLSSYEETHIHKLIIKDFLC